MKSSTRFVLRKVFALLFCLAFVMASIGIGPSQVALAQSDGTVTTSGGATTFDTDVGTPVIVDPYITLSDDPVCGNPEAFVEIAEGYVTGDVLAGGSWSAPRLTVTAISWAALQTALRAVTFDTTSTDASTRLIVFTVGCDLRANAVYDDGTDHYYEYVSTSETWVDAKTAAESFRHAGLDGYLATIGNQGEQDFIEGVVGSRVAWIGASDAYTYTPESGPQTNAEDEWYWVTGPVSGTKFYTTTVGCLGYCNWAALPPSGVGNCALLDNASYNGAWRFVLCNGSAGYVVEYGGTGFGGNVSTSAARDTKTVIVSDNHAPEITEGTSTGVTMSMDGRPDDFNLTLNATDDDGDTLTWSIFEPPTDGMATASGVGNSVEVHYDPEWNYHGTDSFVVQVADATLTDTITVNVTVEPGGTIVINKVTDSAGGTGFVFSTDTDVPGAEAFTLDHGGTKTITNVHVGTYHVIETDPDPGALPEGYVLSNLVCTAPGSSTYDEDIETRQVTITIESNETVSCTFTNSDDYDSDGLLNSDECQGDLSADECVDTDNDGMPDYKDLDSDDDGTPDAFECPYPYNFPGGTLTCPSADNDDLPDYRESDDADSDGDGLTDQYDDTNDGDSISDHSEASYDYDEDEDGILDCFENNSFDSDGDGDNDWDDKDADNDGILDGCNYTDTCHCERFADYDGDHIPNRLESNSFDSDAGGSPDYADIDSDGDGTWDWEEGTTAFSDTVDSDGVPDRIESSIADSDGDGTVDQEDSNSDDDSAGDDGADGADGFYTDSDGDGIPDRYEANDHYSDGDNTADDDDTDSDDDGDPDGDEGYDDSDEDGIPDRLESDDADSDADGIDDEHDTDSDGDGTPDGYFEGASGEELGDADDDHVPDRYESSIRYSDGVSTTNGFTVTTGVDVGNGDDAGCAYPGTDQCDTDSDDDGIPDGCYGTITVCEKFDDTDNDGVPNRLESNVADSDNDGIKDFEDYDSDGDEMTDHVEGLKDDDNDNMPDRLESRKADSDGDGLYDEGDANSDNDSANDGPEGFADSDGDGIQNRFESDNHYSDTDDTSDQNDPDADDDGIPDGCTCYGLPGGCPDNILVCEGFVDTDYDHIPDRYESNTIDTDADGKEDYLDTDSDDDDIPDGDYDCDGTPNEGEGLYDADGDHVPDRVEPLWHYSDGAAANDDDSSDTGYPLIADGTYTGTYDGDLPSHSLAYTGTDQYDFNCDGDDAGPDGYYNGGEGLVDTDGDGILDRFESSVADSDGDGITDTLDIDSDDDGTLDGEFGERLDDPDDHGSTRDDNIPNRIESSIAHSEGDSTEGLADQWDDNSDNNDESDDNVNERLKDDGDGDGIPDRLEADDHYSDANAKDCTGFTSWPDCDDEHDQDADNDGIPDGDFDRNGVDHQGEGLADSDGDYVPDRLEHNFRDTDGDGDPDSEDKDSDNDGDNDGIEWLKDNDGDLIPDRLESNTTDTDGDGLKDYEDTDADGDNITDTVEILDANPGPGTSMPGDDGFLGDRDNDGVWNYIDYDPTGYFYNKATGEIIASSEISIAVEGPPGAVITITHYGNEGFYQFSTNGVSGTYTLTLRNGPPTGYALACPAEPDPYNPDPPIDPPYDPADVSTKFNSEISSTGFLSYTGCTPYHWAFDLGMNEDGTSVERDKVIINNNFALVPTVGGVTMKMSVSEPALLSLRVVLLVTMVGMVTVINAATHRKRR